ncbi:hypothetical protein M0R04_07800 [Candidatus Dojkabacteria bacterium]|jgi:hypothetical protein|nr:hypothetical protein [Candidatus Dojkabacteria bacterium]
MTDETKVQEAPAATKKLNVEDVVKFIQSSTINVDFSGKFLLDIIVKLSDLPMKSVEGMVRSLNSVINQFVDKNYKAPEEAPKPEEVKSEVIEPEEVNIDDEEPEASEDDDME